MREHLVGPGTAVEKWSAFGCSGYNALVKKYLSDFSFDELDLPLDLANRGFENTHQLPNYYYRR